MKEIWQKSYRGIDYIKLSDLPEQLQEEIHNWLNDDVLINIKTEEGIQRDCIQLKDFSHWYENLYTTVPEVGDVRREKKLIRSKSLTLIYKN